MSSQNAQFHDSIQDSIVISEWIIDLTDFVISLLCCFILFKEVQVRTWFFMDEAGSQVPDGHQLMSHIAP